MTRGGVAVQCDDTMIQYISRDVKMATVCAGTGEKKPAKNFRCEPITVLYSSDMLATTGYWNCSLRRRR